MMPACHVTRPLLRRKRLPSRIVLAAVLVLGLPANSFAQVKVIISGGFRGAYEALLPDFERATGIKVTTTTGASIGSEPTTIPNQIRNGVPADIVILAREGLDELVRENRVVFGSDVNLARSLIGMIVRAGTPRPDISTVEAFKQTLLRARSVAVSTSASGVYLTTKLFSQLGIAEAMAQKVVISDAGAGAVGSGQAEIGLQQVSEVIRVPRSEFVGPIPGEVQLVTVFGAAIVSGSTYMPESRRLIAYLSSAAAAAAIRKSGMEPIESR